MTAALSWKPVRRDHIYCAPACGGGCTYAKYKAAVKAVNALKKRLGKGWKGRVHENLGWFYNVVSPCGRVKVSGPSGYGDEWYTAYLGEAADPTCSGKWAESANTAEEAIAKVVAAAKRDLFALGAILKGL